MLICEANVSWGVSTVIVCNGSYNIHKEEKGEKKVKDNFVFISVHGEITLPSVLKIKYDCRKVSFKGC